jgi:hypothetical protein
MANSLATLENSWAKAGFSRNFENWPWTCNIDMSKIESIIDQCKKDNILENWHGGRLTRHYKEADFGFLNCDFFEDI